jgi:hypothetical protein
MPQISHFVSVKFKESVTQDDIVNLMKSLQGLKDRLNGLLTFTHGKNVSPENLHKGKIV